MSIHIHKKHKYCFICKKKIKRIWGLWDWDYYDYDIGDKVTKDGIDYLFVERYWHKDCAWKNRPCPAYEENE